METACILLVFNRPALTKVVLERIRPLRPARLFVVADGPRAGHPTDQENCGLVRDIVDRGVDWPCEMVRDYSAVNLGCARRVSSGITAALERVSEAIILEDDCLPDPSFFPFCEELLGRYQNAAEVGQIAGYTFVNPRSAGASSYHFSRYPHCWGWATWRRAWKYYDHAMTGCLAPGGLAWLDDWIPNPPERAMWKNCFTATARGEIDSWAYRWTYSLWRHNLLSANPRRSLVDNVGFGSDATHTFRKGQIWGAKSMPMDFPLVHPAELLPDESADNSTSKSVFRPKGFLRRIARRIRQITSQ